MIELIIAVLQLYVIFSIIISVASTLFHLIPVVYSLSNAGVNCYASRHPVIMALAYLVVAFLIAPKLLFMFLDSKAFKLGLYTSLRDQ